MSNGRYSVVRPSAVNDGIPRMKMPGAMKTTMAPKMQMPKIMPKMSMPKMPGGMKTVAPKMPTQNLMPKSKVSMGLYSKMLKPR